MNRYSASLGIIIGIALLIAGMHLNQLAKEKEAKKTPCAQDSK